jgi:metal-dependent amidase/aminoacylase/carboxypeptidase family protein
MSSSSSSIEDIVVDGNIRECPLEALAVLSSRLEEAEAAHWAWHNTKYTIQMAKHGPVIKEDPVVAKHRWKAAYETHDNLAVEIESPPPKK